MSRQKERGNFSFTNPGQKDRFHLVAGHPAAMENDENHQIDEMLNFAS
ncbi:MAG: hypothetical protein HUN04_26440 [Desulfobacter sp.]|nr:MAG: hypothetical protein HUN04_26440 [Desulfobacter sp.]